MRIVLASLSASVLVAGLGVVAAPPAAAAADVTTVASGFVEPTQLAVHGGRILVTDGRRLTEVGRSQPARIETSVLLPVPDGPVTASTSPARTVRLVARRASTASPRTS